MISNDHQATFDSPEEVLDFLFFLDYTLFDFLHV